MSFDFKFKFIWGLDIFGQSNAVVQWLLDASGLFSPPSPTTYTGPTAHWVADSTGTLVNQGGLLSGGQKIPPIRGATIVDGVVTAAGDAMVFEAAATGIGLYSNTFSNAAWVKSNITPTQNAVGPDGVTNSAWTLVAGANDATMLQSVTSAAATRVTAVYLKRKTGTGAISLTVDNGSTYSKKTLTTAWQRFEYSQAAVTNPVYGLKMATSGDEIYAYHDELLSAATATSPIPTTTAAITRAATDLAIPTPLALSDPSGFQLRAKLTPKALPGTDQVIWSDATSGAKLYIKGADNKVYYFHNAKEVASSAALTLGTTVDLGIRQTAAGASISLDQTVTTDATMTTIPDFGTTLEIGSAANANYFTGEIADMEIG